MNYHTRLIFWLSVGVLLIAAIATLIHADSLTLWSDEIWSVFHTSGSMQQILQDPDVTWPFGYYLALHVWTQFATNNDFGLHVFGALIGLLATACLIRAGRRLVPGVISSPAAGLLAGLAFATSSYAIYFRLEVRGYGLMLLTEAAFVWLYLRWHAQPTRGRGAALLIAQIALMYTQFILFVVIGLAGLYTIISSLNRDKRQRIGYWLLLAALTGIAFLPLLPQFLRGFRLRTNLGGQTLPAYFLYPFDSFYHAYSAHADILFALILVAAAIGAIRSLIAQRIKWHMVAWLSIWGIAIPVAAYITKAQTASFTTRYLSFTMPAAFLLIGLGLAMLPRRLWFSCLLAVLLLAFVPWQPYDHRPADTDTPPLGQFTRAMNTNFQPGDQLLVDPNCHCLDPLSWDYYQTLYCPHCGIEPTTDPLAFVDLSPTAQRVWYLERQGSEDKALVQSVSRGRISRQFWGPWYFIATLYEAPPLNAIRQIYFGDSLIFRGVQISHRQQLESGDNVRVTLWWSVAKPIGNDYSISLRIIDPQGGLVIQEDGVPRTAGTPDIMSGWQPGTLYLDTRQLAIPYYQRDGDYTLQLVVYQWRDGVRLVPTDPAQAGMAVTADHALILNSMHLLSYAVWGVP